MVDVLEQLDTGALENADLSGGSAPYPPKMRLALLFYCYAKGIFSSRFHRAGDIVITTSVVHNRRFASG